VAAHAPPHSPPPRTPILQLGVFAFLHFYTLFMGLFYRNVLLLCENYIYSK